MLLSGLSTKEEVKQCVTRFANPQSTLLTIFSLAKTSADYTQPGTLTHAGVESLDALNNY